MSLHQSAVLKAILLLCVLYCCATASGQATFDSATSSRLDSEILKRRKAVNDFVKSDRSDKASGLVNDVPQSADSLTQKVQQLAWRSYFDYKNFGYQHRRNVFSWQLTSSKIIFFVVIGLVLSGIYFAGLQFFHSMKLSRKSGDLEKLLGTELTASAREIHVSSPVLGVIILVLSFLFFFLYLKYVYPISETF